MKIYRLNVSVIGISSVRRGFDVSEACTFDQLHDAIFHALNRHDERGYAFYITKTATEDRQGRLAAPDIRSSRHEAGPAGSGPAGQTADATTVGSVGLAVNDVIYYLFDFREEWWHHIDVAGVEEKEAPAESIRLVDSVGAAPPQHKELEEEDEDDDHEEYDDEG